MSWLRSSRNLLEAPMVIWMVLAVRKHLQLNNLIILDNFGFKNCLKKSNPGDVRVQVLQEPVGGSKGDLLDIQKHIKTTHLIILYSFCFKNCLKK